MQKEYQDKQETVQYKGEINMEYRQVQQIAKDTIDYARYQYKYLNKKYAIETTTNWVKPNWS